MLRLLDSKAHAMILFGLDPTAPLSWYSRRGGNLLVQHTHPLAFSEKSQLRCLVTLRQRFVHCCHGAISRGPGHDHLGARYSSVYENILSYRDLAAPRQSGESKKSTVEP